MEQVLLIKCIKIFIIIPNTKIVVMVGFGRDMLSPQVKSEMYR